jgi:two-component system, OmpR family, sensor kinase
MPAAWSRFVRVPGALSAWSRRARTRSPLWARLVAALLLLVIATLALSGAIAAATLRRYLVGRVDEQLASVQHPITEHELGQVIAQGPQRGHDDGNSTLSQLPSAFVIAATDSTGAVVYGPTSQLVDPGQPLPTLPHATGAQSKSAGTRYSTVGAVRGAGKWRVLAAPVTLSDGSTGTLLIAQSLSDVEYTVGRLLLLLLVVGAVALVVLAGVGYLIVRASLRPLREVERTAAKIAAGDLSRRVPDADPRTEVGQLAGALNTMLAAVETAFAERAASEEAARRSEAQMRRSEAAARRSEERMRRFVADASHELRTPLTSIRGFAELYRQRADDDDSDIRRLMIRIEDEAKRMGLLVEDLLLLARLDQERPLAQAPVDMLAIAGDAVHDAQTIDPDRVISLQVGSTDPPPIVIGDESRLRQVLANLVANALKHTPAGTPVTVAVGTDLSTDAGEPTVTVAVTDAGPGMTPDAAARVFERFYRADASRNRDDGGTGLGLAIVAALVAGHGGTVDVRTAPGAGASFRVTLPLAAIPAASTTGAAIRRERWV